MHASSIKNIYIYSQGNPELYPVITHMNVSAVEIMTIHLGIMKFINGLLQDRKGFAAK